MLIASFYIKDKMTWREEASERGGILNEDVLLLEHRMVFREESRTIKR